MVITASKPNETIEKLLQLANGDRELVHLALSESTDPTTKKAPLEKVVAFIQRHQTDKKDAA